MDFKRIEGGICAPQGFLAYGVHCGLRKNKSKPDLAMICSELPCDAAAVYTQNKVKGATIVVTKQHIEEDGKLQALIINSGNANTCNIDGEEKAMMMCKLCADELKLSPSAIGVASTGIIGEILPIEPIQQAVPALAKGLSIDGNIQAAEAILTTDTCKKEVSVEFLINGTICRVGGMAKGSGMIHPNMATMLCFLTTDVAIESSLLQKIVSAVTNDTFNMVSVDGDTSTNDMVVAMASGKAQNERLNTCSDKESIEVFEQALFYVMRELSRKIASDGEGATKLLECNVVGGTDQVNAKIVAKAVITSSLFKSAMFGKDPNWGRILCAVGYSGADIDVDKVQVTLESVNGSVCVCENGRGVSFDERLAHEVLKPEEVKININLHLSSDCAHDATAWGCDLTYDYVKINAAYHT